MPELNFLSKITYICKVLVSSHNFIRNDKFDPLFDPRRLENESFMGNRSGYKAIIYTYKIYIYIYIYILKRFKYINNYLNYKNCRNTEKKHSTRNAPIKELLQKHPKHPRKEVPPNYCFSQQSV